MSMADPPREFTHNEIADSTQEPLLKTYLLRIGWVVDWPSLLGHRRRFLAHSPKPNTPLSILAPWDGADPTQLPRWRWS